MDCWLALPVQDTGAAPVPTPAQEAALAVDLLQKLRAQMLPDQDTEAGGGDVITLDRFYGFSHGCLATLSHLIGPSGTHVSHMPVKVGVSQLYVSHVLSSDVVSRWMGTRENLLWL
jgi:hypothetical protein